MRITRTFAEDGISLEALIESVLEKELDCIIDWEMFETDYEGKFGGIDYGEE